MDQSIKIVQQPAVETASQTEATIQPVVEKVSEDIREKEKHYMDSTQAHQKTKQLKEEIQQLTNVRLSRKPQSPDKKEELPASSSFNNPPPPPEPPKVKPTKATPKPSRRHRPATPEQAEAEAPEQVRSSSVDIVLSRT